MTVIFIGEGCCSYTPSFSEKSYLNHNPQLPGESVLTCFIFALWLKSVLFKYVHYYRI